MFIMIVDQMKKYISEKGFIDKMNNIHIHIPEL